MSSAYIYLIVMSTISVFSSAISIAVAVLNKQIVNKREKQNKIRNLSLKNSWYNDDSKLIPLLKPKIIKDSKSEQQRVAADYSTNISDYLPLQAYDAPYLSNENKDDYISSNDSFKLVKTK